MLVEPFAVVQASLSPANSKSRFIFPPATRPSPRGAGIISILTLPPFPLTLNGTSQAILDCLRRTFSQG